jgi:iron(III) transport system permease protein
MRRNVSSLFGIGALILWLWAPLLWLGGCASKVLWAHPERLIQALPARGVARSMFVATLELSALTALLALFFGFVCALVLARGPRWIRGAGTILSVLPLALPPTLGATAFLEWTRTPPLRALASLGVTRALPFPNVLVAAVVLAGCFYPVVALPLAAALRALPAEIEDAARLFGSPLQAWLKVLWPAVRPVALASCGVVAALSMWEMGAPDLLDVRTYSVQIYRDLSAADDLDPIGKAIKAALAGVPVLILALLALWPALRTDAQAASKYFEAARDQTIESRDGLVALPIAFLIWLFCPLAPLLVFASQLRPLSVLGTVWDANSVEIGNTIGLATIGAVLIALIGFGAALAWRDWPTRWRGVARALCVLPLLVAPVTLAVALIGVWNRPQLSFVYGGSGPSGWDFVDVAGDYSSRYSMMIIGYIARFAPLSIWLIDVALARLPRGASEAAANLGAPPFRVARTITAPLLRPFVVATLALVWSLCAGELTTSVIINAPGGQTLPVPIFNQMHIGATAEVAALSLLAFAFSGAALLFLGVLASRLARFSHER